MAIINIKGLEGLKGINSLSEEDRSIWINNNKDRLPNPNKVSPSTYNKVADRIYRNDLFRQRFNDEELLHSMTPEERDSYYQESLMSEYTQNRFGNDANYFEIANLTPEGQLDLIERGYSSDEELEKEYQDNIKTIEELEDNETMKFLRQYTDFGKSAITSGFAQETALDTQKEGVETLRDTKLKVRRDILDSVIGEDNKRKRDMVSGESFMLQRELQKGLNNGDLTKEDIDKQFEEIAGGELGSRYYKAFKDAEELKNLSVTDKIQMLSNYIAITRRFGNVMDGLSNLESEMQNYISENQDAFDWAGNTLKNIALGGVAHLMNYRMAGLAMKHAIEGDLEQFLQGKDKDGNELDIWNNPLYWQGVDQFNTLDANEIKKARANGGISKYQNITRAGEEMDYFSWHSMNEAAKQSKYLWSDRAVGMALGGLGGNISKALEPISQSLSKNFSKVSSIATILATGMANAEAEGLNTFQNSLQEANSQIDKLIDSELEADINSLVNSEEGKKTIEDLEKQLKDLYSSPEYKNSYISDENIKEQALQTYKNNLRNQLKPALEELHKEDRIQAEKSAVLAYINTATVSELKTAITNSAFRKVIFNKETRDMIRGNNTSFLGLEDGTVGVQKMSKWAKYGRPFINPAGEFVDEYFDSVINHYGQGVGLSDFDNYIKKKYDPKAYKSFYDNAFGNFLGGLDRAVDTVLDKEAYYEGFLGMIGGGFNFTPNISGMWNIATNKEYREELKNQTILEKINNYITNPILSDIADNLREERDAQRQVDDINKILNEHRADLEDMGALVSTMGEWDESVKSINQLDALDAKQAHIFSTMYVLNSLSRSPIATQSSLYQNAMRTIKELANDKMSEEELSELVDSFLGIGDNKSIASRPDAIEEAKSRLKENAKAMLDMKSTIDEVNSMIDKNPNAALISSDVRAELAFLKMRNKNWQKRLSEIQENLGTTSNNSKSNYIYGSKKAIINKINSLDKYKKDLQKELESIKTEREEANKEANSKDKEVASKAIQKLASLNLHEQTIKERIEKTNLERKSLEETNSTIEKEFTETLSEEEILRLHPEDRAYILDPKNLSDYSPEQQAIIKTTINNLKLKDPALIQQIQDAAELSRRVDDVSNAFAKITDNPIEASNYFDLMRQYRNEAFSYLAREKAKHEVSKMFEGKTDDEVKIIAKNLPTIAIEDYIEEHPEKADLLNQVKPIATLREDARNIINELAEEKGLNIALKNSLINLTEDAETVEEAINNIEDAIDSDAVDSSTKAYLDNILSKLERLKYQRNATKVKTREDKKKREEELAKSREKENKKIEEAKKEAEKKVEENKPKEKTEEKKEEKVEDEPVNVGTEETLIEDSLEEVDLDSPSLEIQEKETPDVEIIDAPKTSNITSTSSNSSVLVGNAIYGYNGLELRNRGIQTSRTGVKPDDTMSKFFNWIKAAGIKLQEIIDNELNAILSKNPKIQFLMVNPNGLATHDDHMQDHILEVVEYTSEVAKVHNESYGGVIEANGKKWLVIGTLGFNGTEQGKSYRTLKYELKKKRFKYFNDNSTERFFVDPDYYTEVKEIGAGWIVRQLESDTEIRYRTIQELLESPERNPRGLKMEDLKWGIQQGNKFATVRISHRNKIVTPIDITANLGNTFLMIESANGKYIPVAIRPTMYTELRKGELTDEINTLLMELTSPVFKDRLKARKQLASYLYLKDSENTILIGNENSNTLSIKKNGVIIKTFNLNDPSFNSMEYMEAIESLNPRVNITSSTLSSPVTIKKFDDAGALSTDAAKLGTSNADFTVKNIGTDGKPINTDSTPNESPKIKNSELARTRERSFNYQGKRYRRRENEYYTELGELITDPRMIEQLHYSRILQESKMNPVEKTSEYEYFIISEDKDKPIAIKRNINNGSIIVASEEESRKMIQRVADNKAKENANKIVEVGDRLDVSLDETSDITDELFEGYTEEKEAKETEDIIGENPSISEEDDINTTGTKSLAELQNTNSTDTFMDIICSEEYGDRLDAIIDEKISSGKWKNVPDDLEARAKYLQSKGIATTGIKDVESWLSMIEECK